MHIICHMISTADGRLRSSAWSRSADPVDISAVYESAASRFSSDGWIVGRTTMAEYGEGVTESLPAVPRPEDSPAPLPFAGRREGRPLAVVFDPKGKLRFAGSSLPTGEHLTAVLSPNVGDAHLEALRRAGVSLFLRAAARNGAGCRRPWPLWRRSSMFIPCSLKAAAF